ncbi:divergent polysaccharide deacetylase family protein [Azospirillum doebereinerae]
MARKAPRKTRKAGFALPAALTGNPILLALAAVAAVFAIGLGVSLVTGGGNKAPPVQASIPVKPPVPAVPPAVAVNTAPPPVAAPPAAEPVPQPSVKPDPSMAAAESERPPAAQTPAVQPPEAHPEPHPPAAPPKTTVAMLPPPVPPVTVNPPSGNAALWRRNAVPVSVPPGKPVIAIVIDDMGLDRKRSTRMASLPGPLTLSWLPYARDLPAQARAARANGHELMLHMPMEPSVKADPGPSALLVGLDKGEVLRRFRSALDSFDGYVGVNNHMGSRFTADRAALAPVLAELHRRGLLWLDSRTSPKTAGIGIAQELRMPFAGRDIFLDNTAEVAAIRKQLAQVEQVAKRQGFGIAIGHPHDATIEALASWVPDVQKRGYVLVPVSAVVRAHHAGG